MRNTPIGTGSILVDAAALSSTEPEAILDAVDDFARWAVSDAMLVPGEFPDEAAVVVKIWYYVGQVCNGGHWQFTGNSGMDPVMLRRVGNGLIAVGAPDYHAIFQEFLAIMAEDAGLTAAAFAYDYTRKPASIKSLDSRFFALDRNDLFRKLERWIQSLPCFTPLPADALAKAKATIIARNKRLAARKKAATAAWEAAQDADPNYVAAKRLCRRAGLEFLGFNAGQRIDRTQQTLWFMRTDKGIRHLAVGPGGAKLLPAESSKSKRHPQVAFAMLTIGYLVWIITSAHRNHVGASFLSSIVFLTIGIVYYRKVVRRRRSYTIGRKQLDKLIARGRKAADRLSGG
jgi:hypothetical protein